MDNFFVVREVKLLVYLAGFIVGFGFLMFFLKLSGAMGLYSWYFVGAHVYGLSSLACSYLVTEWVLAQSHVHHMATP